MLQLEKSNKTITRELSDVKYELEAQQARVRQQTKELKDALAAKKLAMEEFTELNVKVCPLLPSLFSLVFFIRVLSYSNLN